MESLERTMMHDAAHIRALCELQRALTFLYQAHLDHYKTGALQRRPRNTQRSIERKLHAIALLFEAATVRRWQFLERLGAEAEG